MQVSAKTQVQAAVAMNAGAPIARFAEIIRQWYEKHYLLARLTFPHRFTFHFGVGARMDTDYARRSG
jgi:hypothetical protein